MNSFSQAIYLIWHGGVQNARYELIDTCADIRVRTLGLLPVSKTLCPGTMHHRFENYLVSVWLYSVLHTNTRMDHIVATHKNELQDS